MANIYLAHYFSATTRNDTASVTPIASDPPPTYTALHQGYRSLRFWPELTNPSTPKIQNNSSYSHRV